MISMQLKKEFKNELFLLQTEGLYKIERLLQSPQGTTIQVGNREVLNFCSNNYLGLSGSSEVAREACQAIEKWGFGLSSVRFICGTQELHKELEKRLSTFLHFEDTILFSSCFDANGALFEVLLQEEDAVISDQLNHASIIDGVRLSKAQRYRYHHSDMVDLEEKLIASLTCRRRLIVTDGVFSMDGDIAPLKEICALAEKYEAMVMVDDSHATGYIGVNGRGSIEHCGVEGRVDIVSTTFGKALGGSSGGSISGSAEIVDLLRQRARPYLFSNTLAPAIAGGTLAALKIVKQGNNLRKKIFANAKHFRKRMEEEGFNLVAGETAIIAVMLYDEVLAITMADQLLREGIYVIGFCYPVVPKGQARIRVQLSALHSDEEIERAVQAFVKVRSLKS